MDILSKKYEEVVVPYFTKNYGTKNRHAIPKVIKVVVNMGVGEAVKNKELMTVLRSDLGNITGQLPAVRQARVSVASFNVRKGMSVGLKVTLRGVKMRSFLQKLFSIVLPRLRDFRGVKVDSFDRFGNYTLGIEDHSVFPEIDLSKSKPHGLEITIVTSTDDSQEAKDLLKLLGMPFEKK